MSITRYVTNATPKLALSYLLAFAWACPSAKEPTPTEEPAPTEEPIPPKTPISSRQTMVGVNLGGHVSWGNHMLFVDAMMRARPWISFPPGTIVWDAGVPVPLDEHRMPIKVPFIPEEGGPALAVRTVFYEELNGNYPKGEYVVSFKGSGEIHINGDPGSHRFTEPGRYPIEVQPGLRGWFVEIIRSDEDDPIRDLHVWLPGLENAKRPIHPLATYRLEGLAALRAMQTMATNTGSYPCHNGEEAVDPECVHKWSDRTKPDFFTQHWSQGMALEYVIAIANQAGTDLWPGIPHAADDEWVRKAAIMIRDQLDPRLKVYVELSNETWNSHGWFPQHDYFRNVGRREKLFSPDHPEDDYETGRRAFVRRSVQVYKIFEEVFGSKSSERIVKVMPAFFAWSAVAESLMNNLSDRDLNPSGIEVDALAVGAYFSADVQQLMEDAASSLTSEQLLDVLESQLGDLSDGPEAQTFAGMTKAHALLAAKYNIPLIAYEGGQHLTAWAQPQDPAAHQLLFEANRSPRMEQLYDTMFEYWFGAGGKLFLAYEFMGRFSQYGAFGHLEHNFQPIEHAPKFRSIRRQVQAMGGHMNPPVTIDSLETYRARWQNPPSDK